MSNDTRHVLTPEQLLPILNKTESIVKLGISINYVIPFFKQYRLQLRVLDIFGKMICRYDPGTRDSTNTVNMYCMVKGHYVYILHHD